MKFGIHHCDACGKEEWKILNMDPGSAEEAIGISSICAECFEKGFDEFMNDKDIFLHRVKLEYQSNELNEDIENHLDDLMGYLKHEFDTSIKEVPYPKELAEYLYGNELIVHNLSVQDSCTIDKNDFPNENLKVSFEKKDWPSFIVGLIEEGYLN